MYIEHDLAYLAMLGMMDPKCNLKLEVQSCFYYHYPILARLSKIGFRISEPQSFKFWTRAIIICPSLKMLCF